MTRPLADLHLLVLDDDTSCLEEITEFLASAGADTLAVTDPAGAMAALDAAARPAPDAFVVDMELPGMTGLDFVIRQFGEAALARTVIITGHYGRAEEIRQRGGTPMVLTKPLSLTVLRDTVAQAVGRKAPSLP